MKKEYKGQCLCGNVKFTINSEPKNPHLCYCHMCQVWSGAPVTAWVNFLKNSIEFKRSKPSFYRSSNKTQRAFCSKCGSSLFAQDDGDKYTCFMITIIKQKDKIVPEYESFKESCPKWKKLVDLTNIKQYQSIINQ